MTENKFISFKVENSLTILNHTRNNPKTHRPLKSKSLKSHFQISSTIQSLILQKTWRHMPTE